MNILLDIVFQSGTFYNDVNSWWVGLVTTILVVAVPIGIFYFTLKNDKKKEEEKQKQFRQQKMEYFKSLVDDSLESLSGQIGYYKKFAKEQKENLIDKLPLLLEVNRNCLKQIIYKINQEDYYHSYLKELGDTQEIRTEFHTIIKILNHFDDSFNLYRGNLKKSRDDNYKEKIKIKDIYDRVIEEIAGYEINKKLNEEEAILFKKLKSIAKSYPKEPNNESNFKDLHDDFLEVMMFELTEFIKTIPDAYKLFIEIKNAINIYNNIKYKNEHIAIDFENYYKKLDEDYSELEEATKRLMKYKSDK